MKIPDTTPIAFLITGVITGALGAAFTFPHFPDIPNEWGSIFGSFLGVCGAFWVARATFKLENRTKIAQANQPLRHQIFLARSQLSMANWDYKDLLREIEETTREINVTSTNWDEEISKFLECNRTNQIQNNINSAIQPIERIISDHFEKLEAIEIIWIEQTRDFLRQCNDFEEIIKLSLREKFHDNIENPRRIQIREHVPPPQNLEWSNKVKQIQRELRLREGELEQIILRLDNY